MTEPTNARPTTTFWSISIIALLWNLSGVFAFFGDAFISKESLAGLPEAQRSLYESIPIWLNAIYGIAVIAGTTGCIALLMRKSFAIALFLVSLIAAFIQMAYSSLMTNALEVYGIVSIIMPIVVIGIGVFLFWYSKRSRTKGWLS